MGARSSTIAHWREERSTKSSSSLHNCCLSLAALSACLARFFAAFAEAFSAWTRQQPIRSCLTGPEEGGPCLLRRLFRRASCQPSQCSTDASHPFSDNRNLRSGLGPTQGHRDGPVHCLPRVSATAFICLYCHLRPPAPPMLTAPLPARALKSPNIDRAWASSQ